MSEYIKVAVDAMGGDYAPQEPVKGVIDALRKTGTVRVSGRTGRGPEKKSWKNIPIRKTVWKWFTRPRSLKPENRRYMQSRKRKTPLW